MVVYHFISNAGKRNINQSPRNSKMWGGAQSEEHSVEREAGLTDWALSFYLMDACAVSPVPKCPKIMAYRRMLPGLPDLGKEKKIAT